MHSQKWLCYRIVSFAKQMVVREYHDRDLDALLAIHAAQGFDYGFPDLSNPLFVTKLVLDRGSAPPLVGAQHAAPQWQASPDEQNSSGSISGAAANAAEQRTSIVGAVLLRLTAEAYLLLDPRVGTPRERWQWLLALHAAAERDAWRRGLEDVHAWLPPPIAQKFGKHIERLGWLHDDVWTPYCKRLEGSEISEP